MFVFQLHCGKAHMQSQWERSNFDPIDIKIPEIFQIWTWHPWLRPRDTPVQIFISIHSARASPQIGEILQFCDFFRGYTVHQQSCGTVYCNRSCLWVCVCVCLWVHLWVSYHDISKLHASILTKLGLYVKVVTISSWLNFDRSASPGMGSAVGQEFLAPPYYSQRAVFSSPLSAFLH